ADTARTPNEGYTSGSGSVKGSAMAVRIAAATARERLCELAAEKWDRKFSEVYLDNGFVATRDGSSSMSVSEILEGKQWNVKARLPSHPIPKEEYRLVGKSIKRPEIESIVRGKGIFVHDMIFPEMLHARILRPPRYTSSLAKCDVNEFKKIASSDIEVLVDGSFVAVVASNEYGAIKAIDQLRHFTQWDEREDKFYDDQDFGKLLPSLASTDEEVISDVDSDTANADGLQEFGGSFYKPYTLHASLGPACGIALFDGTKLQVWSHSQGVFPLRQALSGLLEIDETQIRVTGVPGPGCFGHNSSDDAAADASVIALKFPSRPIRVCWSREQENQWEAMGSAMRVDIRVSVTGEGVISAWKSDVWTDAHSTRPNKDPGTLLAGRYLAAQKIMQGRGYLRGGYRNADPYYRINSKSINAHFFQGPLRVSSLRSLGAFANVFAIESIIEEISIFHRINSIDFRINHLEDPRAIAVLEELREMTASIDVRSKEGIGYGFSRYKNNDAYCAVAAHVRIQQNGKVRILKMWAVMDVGEVMNEGGLIQQAEGAMLQAASWTLIENVKFEKNTALSNNWNTYPILKLRDVTATEVRIISRPNEPAMGGGEAATPPTPAAITNAIFQATGKRIYSLPVLNVNV
ncbi:MAG: molybdopterin-dependent oxidoreductase, partial [Saprospiraceae bacterium]|nr:molybdopterin-dependent oxidoreductase [Saprospiraceae bacterium]